MINFFDSAYCDARPTAEKNAILESVCHYGEFRVCDSESFDVVKKKIKVYLSSQEKRFEGLLLLKTVIDQCPPGIVQQNALDWALMVMQALELPGESCGNRKIVYRILNRILQCMFKSPHLKREASMTLLPGLLDILLESSIDDEWIESAAECLSACIKYFPAACKIKKDKIEEFLILLLDRWELKEFEPIAECFAYLPSCAMETSQKVWMEQFKQFISVLNGVLNFLYDGVENGCGDIKICSSKQLPPIPEESFAAVLKLVHRFRAFGLCLSRMLVTASCSKIVVPVDSLLAFLSRTLQMSPSQMERNLFIYSVLPSLYLTALTVLESFMLSCDQQLMSDCHLVSRFLIHAIRSCSLIGSSSKDSLNLVRCAAYQGLQLYFQRFKLFSIPDNHKEYIVSVMIGDTKPSVNEVKLDRPSNSVPHKQPMETPETEKYLGSCRTSTEALKALKDFVSCGNLDGKSFEEICTSVVGTLIEIHEDPLDLPIPYSDESYRLALYSLLHALVLNCSSQNFACLPTSISLATYGLTDPSSMVRGKVQEILDSTNLFVNTVKELIPDSPPVTTVCEDKIALNNEHSIANSSMYVEMNGVLPATSVRETPSQTVDSSKSFHSELPEEPARADTEITVNEEETGEQIFYTNSTAYPSEPEVDEEEEMDVEEEEEDEDLSKEYLNQNGFSSEEECISEEQEDESPSRRRSSPDVQTNECSPKKVSLNDMEDHSEPDVNMMLQDFIPTSPDRLS